MPALQEAMESHALHHQNSWALQHLFGLTQKSARQIIKQYFHCPGFVPSLSVGVNPRGLLPSHLWQIDVTHVNTFAKLSYVHIYVDTFSHLIIASAHTGEAFRDVSQHLFYCFSYI